MPKRKKQGVLGICGGQLRVQVDAYAEAELKHQHDDSGERVCAQAEQRRGAVRHRPLVASAHSMIFPPATSSVMPVIHDETDDARNSVAAATSSGWPIRPRANAAPNS